MVLAWKEEHLDLVLVPSGLLIMLGYHLFHLHKCLNCPETTVIGYENYSRRVWVARILQTARCFVHANFLISMPNCKMPVKNVESSVIKGSTFWVIGLRSIYFAANLLLWIFGPIPMFACSVFTVVLLQYLDRNAAPLPRFGESDKMDKEMSEVDVTY
ncbi:Protein of unknown function- DUF599 [Striga hermonthica]|uniref:Uncharacterized protein n=1 Tax=Striga hermonthica TaxID=68872 RepID=A0A9N7MNR0_STRHE|nr:Protein of unknown function- DUF599 [Striga hermonthica]